MSNVKIIVIGASLGGLVAIQRLLSNIPQNIPVPLAIVQHRRSERNEYLPELLQKHTSLQVKEVEDKDTIQPGKVYLAPTNYHLLVDLGYFSLSTEGPVCYSRPSLNVLFESAADIYRNRVICVVLTGKGNDGAKGAEYVYKKGGRVFVEQPDTAECSEMPGAALALVPDALSLPIGKIGQALMESTFLTKGKRQ